MTEQLNLGVGCAVITPEVGGYEIFISRYRHIQKYVENVDWYLIKETVENLKKVNE